VAEYVGVIAVVGAVMLSLLVVRPYVVKGRDPVGAVPYVVRLLGQQVRQLDPPPRVAPARPRKPVKRRPRPAKPLVVVDLPEWWIRR
jgi:hypothetical protein